MKAIILGAGIGKRLKPKTLPKCLFKIGKETLLERQMRILNDLGIKDITLVIGYQGECWTKKNIEKINKIHRKIVINKKNIDLKRPYSLFCGLKEIEKSDLIVIDGDLIFEKELIREIIKDKRKNLLLASYIESKHLESKGAKITTGKNDKVIKIGYGFPSNILFSGIFKIGEKDFNLFKRILGKKGNWDNSLSIVLEEFAKKTKVYVLTINTFVSVVFERKVRVVESCDPISNWIEKSNGVIRKKTKTGKQKLINEFNFIQGLPEKVKKHFPKIIGHNFNGETVYYDMEYCPYPLFIDLIFDRKISVQESLKALRIIFDFVFDNLYKINKKQTPVSFIRDSYFNKIKQRYTTIKGKSDLLDKITSSDYLIINGKKLKNFSPIINEIKSDIKFLASLEPPFVATYHGDFKFDNMFINPKTGDFVLIDPRGKTTAGHNESDIMEDIAKLFTSCHGYYDLLRRNLFDIEIKGNVINYRLGAGEVVNFFKRITNELIQLLPIYIKNDDNWKKRLFFVESMLMIANAPFHLASKKNEKFSIALLVKGVELLNNFLDQYPLNRNKKFNLINLNTLEDYNYAKSEFL